MILNDGVGITIAVYIRIFNQEEKRKITCSIEGNGID